MLEHTCVATFPKRVPTEGQIFKLTSPALSTAGLRVGRASVLVQILISWSEVSSVLVEVEVEVILITRPCPTLLSEVMLVNCQTQWSCV